MKKEGCERLVEELHSILEYHSREYPSCRVSWPCFNGAAPCWTRKWRPRQVLILSAVMMPKSSGCLDGHLHTEQS